MHLVIITINRNNAAGLERPMDFDKIADFFSIDLKIFSSRIADFFIKI